jgi:hypothetical protein
MRVLRLFWLLLLVMGAFAGFLLVKNKVWIKPKAASNYPLTGTFLVPDTTLHSEAYYNSFFNNLQEIGMDTVVLQTVGHYKNNCATGTAEEISYIDQNMDKDLKLILKIIKQRNLKLFMGTASIENESCFPIWVGSVGNISTPKGKIIAANIKFYNKVKDYVQSQGWDWNDPNFIQGFYLGHEVDVEQYLNDQPIVNYFADMTRSLKQAFPNKLLLASPYKHEKTNYQTAFLAFKNFYSRTSIDIIAPQDSMGTGYVTSYAQNSVQYKALQDASKFYSGKQAWANVETFQKNPSKPSEFIPASILSLSQQISSSKPYVTKQITWIFQHNLASISELNVTPSWTNQYTQDNATRRLKLRNDYIATYQQTQLVNTPTPTTTAKPAIKIVTPKKPKPGRK